MNFMKESLGDLLRAAVVGVVLLAASGVALADGGSCPMAATCPLDGAQAMLVDTEYQGIVAIGVYEHTTTTGQTHRFRMRCN